MSSRLIIQLAALSGMSAVIFGAFGAHAAKPYLSVALMEAYKTGVQYHFYHSLALLLVAAIPWFTRAQRYATLCALFFCVGIVLFSGSLYTLALTGTKAIGIITPIGGVSFIIGWLLLGVAATKNIKSTHEA